MLSPETLDFIQKGGVLLLLLIAVGWLARERNRLLESLGEKDKVIAAKDAIIAAKDDKLAALSERTITAIVEFRGLLQSVVDIFNSSRKR